ncbi:unnamed protein product [Boreogadus saida]
MNSINDEKGRKRVVRVQRGKSSRGSAAKVFLACRPCLINRYSSVVHQCVGGPFILKNSLMNNLNVSCMVHLQPNVPSSGTHSVMQQHQLGFVTVSQHKLLHQTPVPIHSLHSKAGRSSVRFPLQAFSPALKPCRQAARPLTHPLSAKTNDLATIRKAMQCSYCSNMVPPL